MPAATSTRAPANRPETSEWSVRVLRLIDFELLHERRSGEAEGHDTRERTFRARLVGDAARVIEIMMIETHSARGTARRWTVRDRRPGLKSSERLDTLFGPDPVSTDRLPEGELAAALRSRGWDLRVIIGTSSLHHD